MDLADSESDDDSFFSIESLGLPPINQSDSRTKAGLNNSLPYYEVDHVGTGTFQISQLNLLNKRSIEPNKNIDALLSARGMHHRPRETFEKDIQNTTSMIVGLMRGEKVTSAKYKPSPQLFLPHFQRALALERMNKIDKAIEDYNICIKIDSKCATAYFNRAGLYRIKKNYQAAIQDMNTAIRLEPANLDFRTNRSMLFREMGSFQEAVRDTIITRALQKEPGFARALELGSDVHVDSELLRAHKLSEDPMVGALSLPGDERTPKDIEPIIDFLKSLKFFQAFVNNADVLSQIASKIELTNYSKGDVIFEEGQPGNHFYIILEGEVSIVKIKKIFEEVVDTTVLVKMFRGQTFGETALESKGGLRTAGAIASQKTKLLQLQAEEYQTILYKYRAYLKEEVRNILSLSALFQDWDSTKLDYLASFAIVRNYGANAEIMKANEPIGCLMMVKSGIVQLIKSIPRPDLSVMKRPGANGMVVNEDFAEVPGLWILQKNWNNRMDEHMKLTGNPEYVEFTVGVLGSGQVFGELSVLDPERSSPLSAVSSTAVELYCFESDVLLAIGVRFNSTTMKYLNESLTLHDPPAEKIAYYFRSKYNWELRKNKLMSRMKQTKQMKTF